MYYFSQRLLKGPNEVGPRNDSCGTPHEIETKTPLACVASPRGGRGGGGRGKGEGRGEGGGRGGREGEGGLARHVS